MDEAEEPVDRNVDNDVAPVHKKPLPSFWPTHHPIPERIGSGIGFLCSLSHVLVVCVGDCRPRRMCL